MHSKLIVIYRREQAGDIMLLGQAYRRIGVLAALVCAALAATPARADVRRDFDAALAATNCPNIETVQGPERFVLLSEWSGRSLIELARRAGFGSNVNNLGENDTFLPSDDAERSAMLNRMAAGAADGVARLRADSKTFGARLCPLLAPYSFEDAIREQKRANAPVRPYLRFAQKLSRFHGCHAGPIDGAFGPDTRAGWNRMAGALAPDKAVPEKGLPLPGDVLALTLKPVAQGACDMDAGAAAQPLYDFVFTSPDGGVSGAQTVAQFDRARQFSSTRLRDRVVAATLGDWNRYDGPAEGGSFVSEEEVFARFWPLVQNDFARFVDGVAPPERDDVSDVYLIAAQRALYGIGVAAMPEPTLALLEKLAPSSRHARYLLAGAYQFGLGVPADAAKASHWLVADPSDLSNPFAAFAAYEAARSDGKQAADYVHAMLAGDGADQDAGATQEGEEPQPFQNVFISIAELGRYSRLTRLILSYPEALEAAKAATPEQRFIIGEMILENRGGDRPARETGIALIASAAADGLADAALRLAHIRRFQDAPDPAEAERLYGVAVSAGSPEAAFALAEMWDEKGELGKAKAFYDRAVNLHAANPMGWDLATALQNRIVEGSPFFAARDGANWLESRIARDYKLAQAIGDAYLCVACGGIVDVGQAAEWYRNAAAVEEASDRTASTKLARLLLAQPMLEKTKGEALDILMRNAPAKAPAEADWYIGSVWYAKSAVLLLSATASRSGLKPEELRKAVETFLGRLCPDHEGCLPLARDLAGGEFDAALTATGYETLEQLQRHAAETGGNDDAPTVALADTLASYGDFRGAIALLRPLRADYDDVERSLHTVRRLVAAHLRRRSAELPDGLLDYVRLLAARGADEAKALLGVLSDPPAQATASPPGDVAAAQAAFDMQLARGALSRGVVVAARRLSEAKAAAGDKETALKLEFTALTSELKLAAVDEMFDGALPGRLTKVCLLSRASERVSALGFDDAAITLAKYAVNELQLARRDIAQLPEGLRTCFRDIAANNYRWLADLFIRHQRLDEARYVMGLLKDFETYEFVGRDQDYRKRSYDGFALDRLEQDFTGALGAITVPVTGKARWLAEARWKARNGKLSDDDRIEMAKVEKELAEAARAYQQQLDATLAAVRGLGRADRAAELDNLKALQSFLRSEAGRKAAALHFVVLPQRLHVILTTAQFQTSRTLGNLDGKPFDEAALNRKLDQFRALLQDPGSDPEPMARELYGLLVGPLQSEIEAAGIDTLLVSPDRRLRYVPFAALHDGKGYLAQRYSVALLSDAGYEVTGDHRTGLEISALGMTQAAEDFSALPNVRSELAGIVQGGGASYGFLKGRILMDKDFTRDGLTSSLQFGPPESGALGVVHIASHFALGSTDKDSNLLLGDGSLLSLADIKSDRFTYDFGSVDLLTLSACSTAYGMANSDGRDIESFSEVSRKGGARAILASLWPVNDVSTSLMMQRFYELRERRNLGKAAALAAVQREFISGTLGQGDAQESVVAETARRGATTFDATDTAEPAPVRLDGFKHPFFWAPFIIMGNWQ